MFQPLVAQHWVVVLEHGLVALQDPRAAVLEVAVAATAQLKPQTVPETLKVWVWKPEGTQSPRVALALAAVPFLVTAAQQWPAIAPQVSVVPLLQVVVMLVATEASWPWRSLSKAEATAKPRARRRVALYIAVVGLSC
jgi:hypothetical protein